MANHRRFDDETAQRVVALYESGLRTQDIAATMRASDTTILKVLKQHGVRLRLRKERFISAELLQQMKNHYTTGASFQEVAEHFGFCWKTVNDRLRAAGVQPRPAGFRSGAEHHDWKGGRFVRAGYVFVRMSPEDPFYEMATANEYVLEHRLVMARHLGRALTEDETVHHVDDRDKTNNTLSNLQLRQGNHGKGAVFRCRDCGSHNVGATPIAGQQVN